MLRRIYISFILIAGVVGVANGTSESSSGRLAGLQRTQPFAQDKKLAAEEQELPSPPGGPASIGRGTITELAGGSGGKEIKPRYCKKGFVTEIYGTVGMGKLYHMQFEVITSLGMRCSDGTDLGAMGTVKGKPFSIKNNEGFTYISVKSGAFVDHITAWVDEHDHTRLRVVGEAGGPGGDHSANLSCGGNGKIIGYAGRAGGAVDAIQIICSE